MWSEVPRPTGVITEESLEEETAGRVILFLKEIRNIFTAINTQVKFGIMETPLSPGTMPFPESQTISFSGWS